MMFKALTGVTLLSYSLCSFATLETESDKLSYSLGVSMAEQLKPFDGININAIIQGIEDNLGNQVLQLSQDEVTYFVDLAQTQKQKLKQVKYQKEAQESLEKSRLFLAKNSKKPGIVVLESGLQYRVLTKGSGIKPSITDHITVHYEGRRIDGTLFESSYTRNQPATFQLNRVIAGWTEGIQKMPEGSTWELFIPSTLAYGSSGIPGIIGPNEAIIFKIELRDVNKSS
ncbi:FKBP-type peptidyl-prolyl cis-trans isomerase [Endozoicomonas sp. SCSIO W0465]|uniref:FKBP-type peptidyl-prolyl cis-trans isomerase n=1 Tax=Endozoicomonas sp. SCSIO W0465 TaxID=2918516 RepID=UPI00207642D7|nr:FKBP-type peptidyl-prolyl cis-trans isomerase [Endozoicomonas sp. SCSIO W0465]USE36567.1 FKBP-type peptidyl-prolyl cis-trans isomerase [Endozoicomonas sp. SCSIO W0465]